MGLCGCHLDSTRQQMNKDAPALNACARMAGVKHASVLCTFANADEGIQ